MGSCSRNIVRLRSRRRFASAALAALAGAFGGCSSSPPPTDTARSPAGLWSHSPEVCGPDEVREYQCEELISTQPAMPAPAPYESCPMNLESPVGVHAEAPPVAIFDRDYTAHIRRRAPPGHSCCYSWCARLRIVDSDQVAPSGGCDGGHQMREQYCFDELEGGASDPAPAPFARCPAAIAPPQGVAFAAPKAAAFDPQISATRRAQSFKECCYGWCSAAPPEALKKR
jgi:hypothetical protein